MRAESVSSVEGRVAKQRESGVADDLNAADLAIGKNVKLELNEALLSSALRLGRIFRRRDAAADKLRGKPRWNESCPLARRQPGPLRRPA